MILRKRAEEILNLVQKTEREISLSDQIIIGDVYIGAGETDAVRFIAKAARKLYKTYPGIHYHIASGNAEFVLEQLDKGLIDFGIVFGSVDHARYHSIPLPYRDTLGVRFFIITYCNFYCVCRIWEGCFSDHRELPGKICRFHV